MNKPIVHKIFNQTFWLSAQRSLFWEEEKALILSDLHLGKTGHFRKAGIPVPQAVLKEDMQRLLDILQYFTPTQLIVVGDFFHSAANLELDFFNRWRENFAHLSIKLVRGNHDILKKNWYKTANIEVIEDKLWMGDICFTHNKCEDIVSAYTFCGHIHPGIAVNGLGKQTLRFPCFYLAPDHCILPAFGKFTGLTSIHPKDEDVVYAIVENDLIRI